MYLLIIIGTSRLEKSEKLSRYFDNLFQNHSPETVKKWLLERTLDREFYFRCQLSSINFVAKDYERGFLLGRVE